MTSSSVAAHWLNRLVYPLVVLLIIGPVFFLHEHVTDPFKVMPEFFIVTTGWVLIGVSGVARALNGHPWLSGGGPSWTRRLLAGLAAWLLITCLFGVAPQANLAYAATAISYLLIGQALLDWIEGHTGRRRFLVGTLVGLVSLELLIAVLQLTQKPLAMIGMVLPVESLPFHYLKVLSAGLKNGSAIGTFGNVNYLAEFLVLTLPILLGWSLALRRRWVAAVAGLGLAMTVYFLTVASSRGATLGLIVALPVALLLAFKWGKLDGPSRLSSAKGHLVMGVVSLVAVVALAGTGLAISAGAGLSNTSDIDVQSRLVNWQAAAALWRDDPLTGTGLGGMKVSNIQKLQALHPEGLPEGASLTRFLQAHNDPLQGLAEIGLIGMALAIGALFMWVREVTLNPALLPVMRFGLFWGVGAFLISACFGFPFHIPLSALAFVVVVSLGLARTERSDVIKEDEGPVLADSLRMPYAAAVAGIVALSGFLVVTRDVGPLYEAHRLYFLADVMAKSSKPEGAEDLFALAADRNRFDPQVNFQVMKTLHTQGRYAEIIQLYEANPNTGMGLDATMLYARALQKLGRTQEALKAYTAVTHYYAPKHPNARRATRQIQAIQMGGARPAAAASPASSASPKPTASTSPRTP